MTNKKEGVLELQAIVEGRKVKGIVIKQTSTDIFIDCDNGLFTGVILQKEVRDLERNQVSLLPGAEVEAEIINPDIRHKEGYYIISISKLLQIDARNGLVAKADAEENITVIPTEANLGGLLVDMHGIKGFIPLSQLAPVHYPRVEDGDQEIIFDKLLDLIGQEFTVKIISIDEDEQKVVLSEREALKEETEEIMSTIKIGSSYEGVVSGISSYGVFVTLGGSVEGLVHISELTYGHVGNINKLAVLAENMKVKVIGLENGKISLSHKKLQEDPRDVIMRTFKIGDILEGEVVRFVPYGVFIKMHDDINGLIHLSELSDKGIANPAEAVKLGQIVKAKIILLDPRKRKIGLSMRALYETPEEQLKRQRGKTTRTTRYQRRPVVARRPVSATTKASADEPAKKTTETIKKPGEKVEEKTPAKVAKKPATKKATAKKTEKKEEKPVETKE